MDEPLRVSPEATRALFAVLDRISALREREQRLMQEGTAPGSPGALVREMPGGRYAEIFASQFIVVAGDNLMTWHSVLHAGVQPAYGHLSLLRTALETAVNARWILDPSISHAMRIARGVAAQWVDWDERRKYEETTPSRPRPEPPAKTGAERRADLERERAANGIAVVTLNATEAARRYVVGSPNGAGVYRLLSAFVHGTQWSLLASETAVLLGANPPPRSHVGRVMAKDEVSVAMTSIVVSTYAAAIDGRDSNSTATRVTAHLA